MGGMCSRRQAQRRRRGEDDSDAPTPTGDRPALAHLSAERERELAIVPGATVPGAEETSLSEKLAGPTGNPILVGVLC